MSAPDRNVVLICKVVPADMPIDYFAAILRACDEAARNRGFKSFVRNAKDGSFEILECERDEVKK
jgi:hypothetical protein